MSRKAWSRAASVRPVRLQCNIGKGQKGAFSTLARHCCLLSFLSASVRSGIAVMSQEDEPMQCKTEVWKNDSIPQIP